MFNVDRMLADLHRAIERAQISSSERRFKTLKLVAKEAGMTVFEVAITKDARIRKINEDAINQALAQGWKVRVQTGTEFVILDTSEIQTMVLLYEGNRTGRVEITMKPNPERVEAGTFVRSFSQNSKYFELVQN